MTRRAQRIEDRRHEQLLDSIDAMGLALADGLMAVAAKLNADPRVAAWMEAASEAKTAELDSANRIALDAEKIANAQLDEANYRLERKVRLLSAGLRRALRSAAARRADARESNEWLQNTVDQLGEANRRARDAGIERDRLQAELSKARGDHQLETISALRADAKRLADELVSERDTGETLRQQLKAEQAETARLRNDLRRAAQAQVFAEVVPTSNGRDAVLKAAVEKQQVAQTETQVRQYGPNVRALWEKGVIPSEIARRVNRDLGLSKSALSSYDVTRMAAAMGLGAQA